MSCASRSDEIKSFKLEYLRAMARCFHLSVNPLIASCASFCSSRVELVADFLSVSGFFQVLN